ncbi:MAG: NADP-dependent malic enzyme [Patescibacteria group bacterium]|jgi:malate dehydrogenase (oxaloacetate-decarboxylating)
MNFGKESLKKHRKLAGKIEIKSKAKIEDAEDLAIFYTPGIAAVSSEIAKNECKIWEYTSRSNFVAVVTDGSAVLGLGNIGPEAAQPVMAGKAILFKEFAGVDAIPICLDTQDTDEIVKAVKYLAPSFGGINLEDISAPRCFEIEKKLQNLGIPVMHDDQHGTAVVVLAGLINAAKVIGKKLENCMIVINGVGAAGHAVALAIDEFTKGKANIITLDSKGAVCRNRKDLDEYKEDLNHIINEGNICGDLDKIICGADVFIGLSVGNVLKATMVKKMANNPIIFALANPVPEIDPVEAKKAGAKIVATGRSDYPNQVNNVLAFPGIFRGALDAKAIKITPGMLNAAAMSLASYVESPAIDKILPNPIDKKVAKAVAEAVRKEAIKEGSIRPACK